jgi:hypothetical protein
VSSIPVTAALRTNAGNFFVFTQERFHLFLSAFETIPAIDMIIVDEAHKVGDRQRGILLQEVIERVVAVRPNVKFIFASPQTENPEILISDAPPDAQVQSVISSDVTVNQNLIWATQVRGNPQHWKASICLPEQVRELGSIDLPYAPTSVRKRLPFIAHAMTPAEGGSLLYVDGAADAEKAAELLWDLQGSDAEVPHRQALAELAELVRNAIHDRYSLARVLTRGVGFHYGNIPLLVRNEIERYFKEGHIKYLVCTSTLIEGVNLPCRNIFVRGPKKGQNQPMNEADFWNLAGRAGRWGREFQGNIICVDAGNEQVWRLGTPRGRQRYRIERTTDRVLQDASELIEFIRAATPRDQIRAKPELEYMTSYLIAKFMRSGSLVTDLLARGLEPQVVQELDSVIRDVVTALAVRPEVVWRNPGISPIAMDRLLAYFGGREGVVEELLPVSPSSEDAASQYIAILQRINRELAPVFGVGPRVIMVGLLVTSWMRGHPLKRLITERMAYLTRRRRAFRDAVVIREVMRDVEEIARFQAPKYLSCYVDVLKQYLQSIGRPELLPAELDISILLEFGVPGGTQLSLMGLGLSRTSALALAEFIASDSLSEEECLRWLRENAWEERDLPALVKREIAFALQTGS